MNLEKLQAAAVHERTVAEQAAAAVPLIEVKVERAEAAVQAARESLREAQDEAEATALRAEEAEAAYRDAADGQDMAVNAGVATGKAE